MPGGGILALVAVWRRGMYASGEDLGDGRPGSEAAATKRRSWADSRAKNWRSERGSTSAAWIGWSNSASLPQAARCSLEVTFGECGWFEASRKAGCRLRRWG